MYEKGKKLIKEIKEYYKWKGNKIKPKAVANILLANKMVYLKSIINSVKGDLSEVIFYDIVERIVPKSKRFNFYETNYTDDIAITLERANAVADALKQAKYKVYKKGFLLVDNNDYEMFIKGKFISVDLNSIKSKEYIDDKSIEYSYYKRNSTDLKSIGDVVIDPCAGSGTSLLAAAGLGRKAYGFEIKKDFYKLAKENVLNNIELDMFTRSEIEKQQVEQLRMF